MKLKIYSNKRGFRAKRTFATLSLVVGLIGVAAVANSSAASAASLKDNLVINPVYQQYMRDVNAGLGSKWVLIPDKYVIAGNIEAGRGGGVSLPTTYNLTTDGYATTQKNQGGDGACWAYATTTAMESYLKKNKNVTVEFAPKQLDYAMTSATEYGTLLANKYDVHRNLGDGGNFLIASIGLRSDYIVDREDVFYARMKANDSDLANYDTFRKYNDFNTMFGFGPYTKSMSKSQIFGDRAEYITDGFERIDKQDPDAITKIKEKVYTKGAVYVGTYAPETEGCWDATTNTVIDRGTVCDSQSGTALGDESSHGHAMAIVGWDDGYAYTDPVTNTTKTGAFVVQNSHGKTSLFNDYGITPERYMDILREAGALEGKTEAEIQTITTDVTSVINNWDAHEFVYLGYDFEKSENVGTIDFASITSMTKNDFRQAYDLTKSTVELKNNKLHFKMRSDNEQDISVIGLDLMIPVGQIEFKVGIDINNDGVSDYDQNISFGTVESGRKTVQLTNPLPVSGDFTIIVAAPDNVTLRSDDDLIVSPIVYTVEASDSIVVPNTGGIDAPNTGEITNDDSSMKFGGIVVTMVGIMTALSTGIIFKNRKHLHKVGFERKDS